MILYNIFCLLVNAVLSSKHSYIILTILVWFYSLKHIPSDLMHPRSYGAFFIDLAKALCKIRYNWFNIFDWQAFNVQDRFFHIIWSLLTETLLSMFINFRYRSESTLFLNYYIKHELFVGWHRDKSQCFIIRYSLFLEQEFNATFRISWNLIKSLKIFSITYYIQTSTSIW